MGTRRIPHADTTYKIITHQIMARKMNPYNGEYGLHWCTGRCETAGNHLHHQSCPQYEQSLINLRGELMNAIKSVEQDLDLAASESEREHCKKLLDKLQSNFNELQQVIQSTQKMKNKAWAAIQFIHTAILVLCIVQTFRSSLWWIIPSVVSFLIVWAGFKVHAETKRMRK
jgi:transcription termination factor NusB